MSPTVRAAVVSTPGSVPELEAVVLAPLAHDEVLIRVVATGVCHTDIAWAAGGFGTAADQSRSCSVTRRAASSRRSAGRTHRYQ